MQDFFFNATLSVFLCDAYFAKVVHMNTLCSVE